MGNAGEAGPSGAPAGTRTRWWRPGRFALLIGLIGLLITASLTLTARSLDHSNEHRLLETQTRQAGDVVSLTILSLENPLLTALQIELGDGGDTGRFDLYLSPYVGPGQLFASASLWESGGGTPRPLTTVGAPPLLKADSPAAQRFITSALHSATFVVTGIPTGHPQHIGYAVADPANPTFAIYAERAIPTNRRVPVEESSAFADLDYATYLGPAVRPSDLTTTDVAPAQLPLRGNTVRVSVPFGNTTVTIVAAPRTTLGDTLGAELPLIFLIGGLLLTLAATLVTEQLVARRREAESSARTITELYEQLDDLYGAQRTIAATLQQALLPRAIPDIAGLEMAVRYVPGARGVDIGGDWYSIVALDEEHFAFVIGDVSGRGVSAATVMAALRYTIRAYLREGHPPSTVLSMCSTQLDILADGHFATVLVGIGEVSGHRITVANAGHFNPLLITDGVATYAPTTVGLPLGVAIATYVPTVVTIPARSTLLAFTDGLVERRGENLEVGLQRLAEVAVADRPVHELLETIIATLHSPSSEDDVAVLALHWTT